MKKVQFCDAVLFVSKAKINGFSKNIFTFLASVSKLGRNKNKYLHQKKIKKKYQ